MKLVQKILAIIILLFSVLYIIQNLILESNRIVVELVDCIDGDTARFLVDGNEKKVRFLSIDTPESNNYIEEFGKEAAAYTCNYLENAQLIELEFDALADNDSYDRLLAWIWVDDILLQEDLVRKGYAEVTYLYDDYKYNQVLLDFEKEAQNNKVGIWQ